MTATKRKTKPFSKPFAELDDDEALSILRDCSNEFQGKLSRLARQSGKPLVAIYRLWRKYSDDCRASDQSCLVWEFTSWYVNELKAV